ncbi:MAG TPA: hypothetical protein VIL97_05340 [Thermoanaerobaculia bacterium]
MWKRIAILMIAAALLACSLAAQNTDIEALSGLQFSFGNPGARSLALGGAFLGLADDASAAEANPAGLTILRTREISFEGRNFRRETAYFNRGTFPDITDTEFTAFSRNVEPSFGSIVLPVKNFAFAAYYHQAANYHAAGAVVPEFNQFGQILAGVPDFYIPRGNPIGSGGPVSEAECNRIVSEQGGAACTHFALFPFVTAVAVDMKTWGLAGAWKSGNFSIGAAIRYQIFEEGAFTFRQTDEGIPVSIAVQATDLDIDTGEAGEEDDITYTLGVKYTANDKLRFGGVYKVGAEFDAPVFSRDFVSGTGFRQLTDVKFHIPDVAGVGVSYSPTPVLTINADLVHVAYSNLVDDAQPINFAISVLDDPYEAEDALEYHVGVEYVFTTTPLLALRAGWWQDPAHAMTYVGPTTCTDSRILEEERQLCAAIRTSQRVLFPDPGKDVNHYSVGVGLAFAKFQIDAAYDTSDRFKVGSLSGVFRF